MGPDGRHTGLEAELCRAVAAAVLGDSEAVSFVTLTPANRFEALQQGDIDVLMRATTHTYTRDAALGLDIGPTFFYDGLKFMGPATSFSPDSEFADVAGATFCLLSGTTTELAVVTETDRLGLEIDLVLVETVAEYVRGVLSGTCDLMSSDHTQLNLLRADLEASGEISPGEWVIFPEMPITLEPYGPLYREDDPQWAAVVDWVIGALLLAEQDGVTSENVTDIEFSLALATLIGSNAVALIETGLDEEAIERVIEQVGNYGEIFDRTMAPTGFERVGPNLLWTDGGLLVMPPGR